MREVVPGCRRRTTQLAVDWDTHLVHWLFAGGGSRALCTAYRGQDVICPVLAPAATLVTCVWCVVVSMNREVVSDDLDGRRA